MNKKLESALIAGYIVLATLAYGHSYANNQYRIYREMSSLTNLQAGAAGVLAPVYWLSVVGVWLFEEAEPKTRPNPFGEG